MFLSSQLKLENDAGSAATLHYGSSNSGAYGGPSALNVINSASAPITFWQGVNERMRIDSTGNVGIGTSNPNTGARLSVYGGAIAAGTTGSGAGNGGQVRFYDLGASGSNFVAFRAPDSIASDIIWTLPAAMGTLNQVLMTDAVGSLTWATVSGSGDFLRDGSVSMTGSLKSTDGTAANPSMTFGSDQDTGLYRPASDTIGITVGGVEEIAINATGEFLDRSFAGLDPGDMSGGTGYTPVVEHSGGSTYVARYNAIERSGDTTGAFHAGLFDVNPTNTNSYALIGIGKAAGAGWKSNTSNAVANGAWLPGIAFAGYTTNSDAGADIGATLNGVVDGAVSADTIPTALVFRTSVTNSVGLTERMRISSSGNVGIGTGTPSNKLSVFGGAIAAGSSSSSTGGEVRYYDLGASGNNYVAFRAPASIAADVTWTLPSTDGGSGNVLQTDGAGSLTWVSMGGGGDFMSNGSVPMTGQLVAGTGSAAAPSITFAGDTNSGFFSFADNAFSIATNGQERIRFSNNGAQSMQTGGWSLSGGVSAGFPSYTFENDTDTGIYRPGANALAFATAGTQAMSITSTGDIGIGTSNPTRKLDIRGGVSSGAGNAHAIYGIASGVAGSPQLELYAISNTNGASYAIQGVSDGVGPGPLALNPTGGNVGIGTTAPSAMLNLHEAAGGYTEEKFTSTATGQTATDGLAVGINNTTKDAYVWNNENTNLQFATNDLERMTITGSGNVGIGTTLPKAGNRLEIRGGAIAAGSTSSTVGGEFRAYEAADGANYVAFRAPTSLAADVTWTLPAAAGTLNQVLATNAAGSLSWITVSGGGGGGDFFRNGSVSMTGQFLGIGGTAALPGITFGDDNDTGLFRFGVNTLGFATGGATRMVIGSTGYVGIGSSTPTMALDVMPPNGQYMAAQFKGSSSDDVVVHIGSATSAGQPTLEFKQPGYVAYQMFLRRTGGHNFYLNPGNNFNNPSSNSLVFTGSGELLLSAGDSPASGARLDVRGGAIAAGSQSSSLGGEMRFYEAQNGANFVAFRAPTSLAGDVTWTLPAAAGTMNQVLATNAAGSLSWVTMTGGGGGDFYRNGSASMTGQFQAAPGSAGAPSISFAGATNMGLFLSGTKMGLSVGGSERLSLDSSSLYSQTNYGGRIRHDGTSTAASPVFAFTSDTNTGMFRYGAGTLSFAGAGTELLRLAQGRAEFIGNPSVYQSFAFGNAGYQVSTTQSGSTASVSVESNASGGAKIGAMKIANGTMSVGTGSQNGSGPLQFYTNDITRMHIAGSGEVGIGTTVPGAALHVVGDIQYTGVITDVSDRRLKKNVAPLSLAMPKIRKMKTYQYVMRDDPDEEVEFGLMAQDLQEILPEVVKPLDKNSDYFGVNYIGLIAWTIKALQEVDAENARLKVENEKLQERVMALEKQQQEQQRMIQSIMERLDKDKK